MPHLPCISCRGVDQEQELVTIVIGSSAMWRNLSDVPLVDRQMKGSVRSAGVDMRRLLSETRNT